MNFGALQNCETRTRTFEIYNGGKFDFVWDVREWGTDVPAPYTEGLAKMLEADAPVPRAADTTAKVDPKAKKPDAKAPTGGAVAGPTFGDTELKAGC